ncbi:MAG: glycosyl hydrolase, partial [Ferruginibacter sp.]
MKRRKFLKLASLSSAALPLTALAKRTALLNGVLAMPQDQDMLFEIFSNPENKYRPYVRWWWNGDRVTKEEVLRELDVMQKAGIGGVEINPIKWNENADDMGIKALTWGSDEWLDVVDTAVKGAKERGMTCDMIVGSGWPYGGEFVPQAEQSQIMLL